MEQQSMPASLFRFILLFSFLPATISIPRDDEAGGGTAVDDGLALLDFKSKISVDPSGVLTSWNSSLDFCQWRGVTCGGAASGKRRQRVTALDLDSFGLSGSISPSLANLTYLQRLRLQENQLHGPIPTELGALPYLLHLNLSFNSLTGPIPAGICGPAGGLQILSLYQNSLQGEIPSNLSRCAAIQTLGLGSNMLVGNIPDFLGNLSTLVGLSLGDNNFASGDIPYSLGNLQSILTIDLSASLRVGEVPPSLWNLSSLIQLGLYQNNLTGALPDNLCRDLPRLKDLLLYENNFYGTIPSSISNASSLETVQFDRNGFTGQVPSNLGALRKLQQLDLRSNQLGGSAESKDLHFITELTNCSNLRLLDADNNRLQGKLPGSIANLSSASMQYLVLGGNNISGVIPPEIGDLVQLTNFVLEENIIGGSIPATIGELINLEMLSLAANMLSGKIPSSVGNLTRLTMLYLGGNQLTGRIPESLGGCQSLELLHLELNQLTGGIPIGIFSIPTLSREAFFFKNLLSGPLPAEVGKMTNIQTFVISYNNFSGGIPGALAGCQHLEQLHMRNNSFSGPIPPEFASLKGLQALDLSANSLSGSIPAFLKHLNLSSLNLSFNHFSGEVPKGGIFLNASVISLLGKDQLCGGSSVFNLPPCPSVKQEKKRHKQTATKVITAIVLAAIGALFLVSLLFFIHRIHRQRSKRGPHVQQEDQKFIRVSYDALSKATDGFSPANLIGAGSFGSVYKGVIIDDDQGNPRDVAVKVFDLKRVGASNSFIAECEAMRSVRHRNLVRIITACSSIDSHGNDFKALVFEFLPNGSLDRWLHTAGNEEGSNDSRRQRLSLVQRLDVAVDVASAVEYLHQGGPSPIVHCDLKPSNVLLDNDMVAHVGDFGLARFVQTTNSSSSSAQNYATTSSSSLLKGSIGYVAPEYGMGSKASTQGDVYSFGILLLEMLTGKRPTDEAFKDGLSLHNFVRMAYRDEQVMGVIDPVLGRSDYQQEGENATRQMKGVQDCVQSMLSIALGCSNESPADRMQIGDVVHQLRNIKQELG